LDDIAVEPFEGGTVEQFLSFMYRNNLRFVEAEENAQQSYFILFQQLMRYYVNMQLRQAVFDERTNRLDQVKRRERMLFYLGAGLETAPKVAELIRAIKSNTAQIDVNIEP